MRGLFGAGLLAIAFPTLSAAKLLPAPVQHMVERVNKKLTAPIHSLFGKDEATAAAPVVTPEGPTALPTVSPEDAAESVAVATSTGTIGSSISDDESQPAAPFQNSDGSISYPDGDGNYDDVDTQVVSDQEASDNQESQDGNASDDGDH